MIQKIIKVGNSLAVVLPKPFVKSAGLRVGDEVRVDTHDVMKTAYIRANTMGDDPGLTPEFKHWLDTMVKEEADIIKALAEA